MAFVFGGLDWISNCWRFWLLEFKACEDLDLVRWNYVPSRSYSYAAGEFLLLKKGYRDTYIFNYLLAAFYLVKSSTKWFK